MCPAVAQKSSDVTVEECADTEDVVNGKAEQLNAGPGSGSIDLNKTEMCDFTARKKRNETAIASGLCEKVGEFNTLLSSCAHEWC